jgi:hypothetical protein
MSPTIEIQKDGAQFRLSGFTVLAFGFALFMILGLPAAHAQSPIGTAESCFEAGPDHVPTFTVTPVPPVRPGFQPQLPVHTSAAASTTAAKLVPTDFTPLRSMPIHVLNAGNKDRWTPPLRKTPELLASSR